MSLCLYFCVPKHRVIETLQRGRIKGTTRSRPISFLFYSLEGGEADGTARWIEEHWCCVFKKMTNIRVSFHVTQNTMTYCIIAVTRLSYRFFCGTPKTRHKNVSKERVWLFATRILWYPEFIDSVLFFFSLDPFFLSNFRCQNLPL